ncbi:putative bifunctional diguanylate cyclase/phosphodiesterase [Kineococcus sp. LSe6-4]|uniref:Bifunctional diguanylate cyclase/phosphodiesterase n=1 Tax=Kineococcus halophytocola TaxID=3234027 RepID=A0ABV4H4M4_9ACTN
MNHAATPVPDREPSRGAWWRWLPRGHALSPADWRRRHRWVCAVLAVHVLAVPAYALVWRTPALHAAGFGAVLAVFLAVARLDDLRRHLADDPALPAWSPDWLRSCAAALGLVVASGEVVQISRGWTEAHFHFFVVVPVVALYEAWAPFAVAAGYVLFQHGIVGTLYPRIVFLDPAAHRHPWWFAGVHALAFAAACVGSLTGWRLAEASRLQQGRLLEQLQHRAVHDPMTGLPNRTALRAALGRALEEVRAGGDGDVAVLVVDLDRFKEVNDTLGHASGDDLLQQVAARLGSAVRDGDVLARVGGDEFAVVLPGSSARAARVVAERMRLALAGNLVVAGVAVDVDASIGVSGHRHAAELRTPPGHDPAGDPGTPDVPDPLDVADEVELLLRQADIAMYSAKTRHTGICLYDPGDDEHSSRRLRTLAELRLALASEAAGGNGGLTVHYLPVVEVATGAVRTVEALLRWHHPARGLLLPAAFVPAAAGTALAEPLTAFVLDRALQQVSRWRQEGLALQVSVNVPVRCLRPQFVTTVLDALAGAGLGAQCLRLEVGDGPALHERRTVSDVLVRLRQAGVGISVDDFGTGLSSLSALRDLPVDELKLDPRLVQGLTGGDPLARDADTVLVRSIVTVAHGLSLRVVAEGVETPALAAAVAAAGCDLAQGFHHCRPVPGEAVPALVRGGFPAGAR